MSADMQPSLINTITVPGVPTETSSTLATATYDRPRRALVRNSGTVPLRLFFDSANGNDVASSGIYILPAGQSDTFILAPKQSLYAVAVGATGLASVHSSDALPFEVAS